MAQGPWPFFIFSLKELRISARYMPPSNAQWTAPQDPDDIECTENDNFYYHDGTRIHLSASAPAGDPYKICSIFYRGGRFFVTHEDATLTRFGASMLRFNHDAGRASFAHVSAQQDRVRPQPRRSNWQRWLLSDTYTNYGPGTELHEQGLNGELPVLLGLVAFAASPEDMWNYLERFLHQGYWIPPRDSADYDQNGRYDDRGFLIKVWPWVYTADTLAQFEVGNGNQNTAAFGRL